MVRTVRSTLLAGGACALLAAAASPWSPGLTFAIRTVSSDDTTSDGRAAPRGDSLPTQVLDGVLRFDIRDGGDRRNQQFAPGSYWLVNSATRTMALVMPARRQYWDARFDSTASALAQALGSITVVSDIEISGTAVGGGGMVNGYPTRRYRITTRYTEVEQDSTEGRTKVQAVEDIWATDALKDVPDPMEAYARIFKSPGAGSGTLGELIEKRAEAQRKLFKGLPIRTVAVTTETSADGTKQVTTSTTDILDLKRVDLDPAGFRVPEGYTRVDLSTLVRSAIAQSVKESAKESAKEGAKEGAKDAAKDAIKGIFGRRKKP